MSSFSRRSILSVFCIATLLGACGFTPIYSDGSAASNLQGKIEISSGKGREFFEMRERLIERFGFANTPQYKLTYTFSEITKGLAVSTSAAVTRFNLYGTSKFKITDMASGAVVFSDVVKSTSAYSATSETYPTSIARQDARSRLATSLADKIITRISGTASQWVK
jgi:LPS-assembly lipoprotein